MGEGKRIELSRYERGLRFKRSYPPWALPSRVSNVGVEPTSLSAPAFEAGVFTVSPIRQSACDRIRTCMAVNR